MLENILCYVLFNQYNLSILNTKYYHNVFYFHSFCIKSEALIQTNLLHQVT